MATNKQALQNIIQQITEQDIEQEFKQFAKKPEQVARDLAAVTDKMSEAEIEKGVNQYGGVEQFLDALVMFLAFKAALIRKGVKVGLAAGAGAALIFGAGSLCHNVALATGVSALDEIGEGIDMAGEFAADIAGLGFDVAADSVDFFSGLLDGVLSLFG